MEITRVILFKKKGDKSDVNNYCRIAILSPLFKVFGKILKERIFNYFDKINRSLDFEETIRHSTLLQLIH